MVSRSDVHFDTLGTLGLVSCRIAMELTSVSPGLKVLLEDENFLVVDKPPGLLSVPGRGPEKADCVVSRGAALYGWVREVHRLDQGTSGLMILARNAESHRFLSRAFAERKVSKSYIALVPHPPSDPGIDGLSCRDGRISLYQRLDPENRPRQIVDPERGKEAITEWRVLDDAVTDPGRFAGDAKVFSTSLLLELRPHTGRTHQLRLALSVCAAPILGDGLYAPSGIHAAAGRLMLHARYLSFPDPGGGPERELISDSGFLSSGDGTEVS